MTIEIADIAIQTAPISKDNLLLEIAIMLYQKKVLSLRTASKIATIHWFEFEQILFDRKIAMHYDVEGLEQDLITLQKQETQL